MKLWGILQELLEFVWKLIEAEGETVFANSFECWGSDGVAFDLNRGWINRILIVMEQCGSLPHGLLVSVMS